MKKHKYKHQKISENKGKKIAVGTATIGAVVLAGRTQADSIKPVEEASSSLAVVTTDSITSNSITSIDSAVIEVSQSLASSAGVLETSSATDSLGVVESSATPSSSVSSETSLSESDSSGISSASSTIASSEAASSETSISSNLKSSAAQQQYEASETQASETAEIKQAPPVYAAPTLQYEPNAITADYKTPTKAVSFAMITSIAKLDSASTQAFIDSLANRVRVLAGKNNLFASIIIAQAILESGHGTSGLSRDNFNIFGIKGSYKGRHVSLPTFEYDAQGKMYQTNQNFRFYSSYDESLDDYIDLMVNGTTWNDKIYSGTWKSQARSYEEAVHSLLGSYATDPNYVEMLLQIIEEYHLDQYDDINAETKILNLSTDDHIELETSTNLQGIELGEFPAYNNQDYAGAEGYAFGNCTRYAFDRVAQLGGKIPSNLGDAREWGINAEAQGYYVTMRAKKGYVVSFLPGIAGSDPTYGHVAFVEKVNADGTVLISEMNALAGFNAVNTRIISAKDASLAFYIQPK